MSEIHISRLPVTLLGNDSHTQSLCRVTAFAVGRNMQHSRSVKEYNDVRILFDCSAFAQVCQFRTTSGTVLRFTVQLAQQYDGDMQLLCQQLRFAGGLCHLLFPVPVDLLGAHVAKLQVVDDNHVTLLAAFQQPCARTDVIHADGRTVVHVDRQLCQSRGGGACLRYLLGIGNPVAPPVRVDVAGGH